MRASVIAFAAARMPDLFDFCQITPHADIVLNYILQWACPRHSRNHHALNQLGAGMLRAILDATVDDERMKKLPQPEYFATVVSSCRYLSHSAGGEVQLTVQSPVYSQFYRGSLHDCDNIYMILEHDVNAQYRKKSGARDWRGWDVSIACFGFCDGGDCPLLASFHGLFLEKNARAVFRKHPPTGDAAIDAYRNYLLRNA